jgi:hypothetical protein
MNLVYTVEVKDWENEMEYPVPTYQGSSLVVAMAHFKDQHLKGEDVVLFIEDEEGSNLDTVTNYNNHNNDIINCNDFFLPSDNELTKQRNDAIKQKEIYTNLYNEQVSTNDQLKKDTERLHNQVRQQQQEINKLNEQSLHSTKEVLNNTKQDNNKLYWYAYRLRGFSPFCQPKGHVKVDQSIGRHGVIAYDRPLTQYELDEYELTSYSDNNLHQAV